jgi:hypothetical protein
MIIGVSLWCKIYSMLKIQEGPLRAKGMENTHRLST